MSKSNADYVTEKLRQLDTDAFTEVMDKATDRSAETYVRPKDKTIHVFDLQEELKIVRSERGKFKGLSTGLSQLDARMGGLESGSVVLVSGATSEGKSALATNIAANVAGRRGVLYISLEMSRMQMLDRLDMIHDDPNSLNLVFQESFALNYHDIEPLLKSAKKEHSVELVVIDYLQYLGRGMDLTEVAKMSKEIKSLALRYGVAMLVITSIRKGDAKFRRKWTEVDADDLMGTSAIAYDADTIVVVSRKDEENEYQPDKVYVRVLKTRNTKLDYNDRTAELNWENTRISEEWQKPIDKA